MNKHGLFVISGPSGAGKGSIVDGLLARREKLYFSVSATTRPRRGHEVDGREYHFVSVETFRDKIEKGLMLEWAEYEGQYYGTPAEPVYQKLQEGWDVLLDIEANGMRQVREKLPEAVTMFVYPVSFRVLEQRLRDRGTESEEKIQGRLRKGRRESEHAGDYDYIIVNDTLETAIDEADAILTAANSGGDPTEAEAAARRLAEACITAERLHILKEDTSR